MHTLSKHLFAALLSTVFLASCSRPVAYFQPTAREHFAAVSTSAVPVQTPVSEAAAVPAEPVAQANTPLDQVDALVRNDSKLATNKTVQKRLNRVRSLLTASAKTTLAPASVNTPKKMNLMQRLMLKKMNKKISRQLAPANPDKAMAVKGILALGAVVLIAGILLALLTSGTGATIGVIGIIAGLVLLLIGLI